MYYSLQNTIERLVRAEVKDNELVGLRMPLSKDDIGYIVDEIWRGRSVISGLSNRLVLVPWKRPAEGFKVNPQWEKEGQKLVAIDWRNLVCMTKEEAVQHEREVLLGNKNVEELYDDKVLQLIDTRLKEAEIYEQYR
jgi:hypothetical protein